MAGPLKALFGTLQQSAFMSGVSFVFGDEEVNTQRYQLPCVVMAPRGGPYTTPGDVRGVDPSTLMLWEIKSTVDFWLWAASSDPANQAGIDHVDAVESLRTLFLSALQDQRVQYTDVNNLSYGLQYKAVSERWQVVAGNSTSRLNRSLVITVTALIPVAMAPPVEAQITSIAPIVTTI
jgi:hypothetical protein